MKKPGMATHSESSFNEAREIRILESRLEEKKSIKTFFKENDRTPNYDGTFELVGEAGTPKKQFIVQVKKVENLVPKENGKHSGKYIYQLETPFLYYVKEKVTESPAIYFVVDIASENIFYLYLSDECLMALDFEDQYTVQYEFSEEDMLVDIDEFYREMDAIATERNRRFVKKTPEEIAEIQDAAEYINDFMNNDFKVIKETRFPDIWRFGVACSNTEEMQITCQTPDGEEITLTSKHTGLFALYPQYKGQADYGFREFDGGEEQYFQNFDMIGDTSYKKYAEDTLQKIVENFCDKPPIELLPTEILIERIYRRSMGLNEFWEGDEPLSVSKAYRQCVLLFGYMGRIILNDGLTKKERAFRNHIIKDECYREGSINLFDFQMWKDLREDMLSFAAENWNNFEEVPIPSDTLFSMIQISDVEYFVMTGELAERADTEILPVVDFNIGNSYEDKTGLEQMREICKTWFERLPEIYIAGYKKIFDTDKYRFSCKVKYDLYESGGEYGGECACIYNYRQEEPGKIDIEYCHNLNKVPVDKECPNELENISRGYLLEPFVRSGTPVYDGFRCWLYQGICDGLEFECPGLTVHYTSDTKLFGK